MRAQYATRAYSNLEASGHTEDRSPAELVVLLFEKACSCLKTAALIPINDTDALDLTDRLAAIEQFHKATSKAMQIVVALREMLDMESGGGTSTQLAETYTIIANNTAAAAMHASESARFAELNVSWTTECNNRQAAYDKGTAER